MNAVEEKEMIEFLEAEILKAKARIVLRALALILGIAGVVLLAWVDWRVALGVFLLAYGGNLSTVLAQETERAKERRTSRGRRE